MALSDILFEAHTQIREYVAASPSRQYSRYRRRIDGVLEAMDRLREILDRPPPPAEVMAVSIVEVVTVDMTLIKMGNHLVGCCPLHLENTPSFLIMAR